MACQPVHLRHGEVQQQQVRAQLPGLFDSLAPGRSFAADLQLRPDFEERANASANHFVIIGDQNG
jgi:hypothetical protein